MDKKRIEITPTVQIAKKIEKLAAAEGRTVKNYIETWLEHHVKGVTRVQSKLEL